MLLMKLLCLIWGKRLIRNIRPDRGFKYDLYIGKNVDIFKHNEWEFYKTFYLWNFFVLSYARKWQEK